nr:uncharacterized protein LOC105856705 [Microcebus murinus]
MQSSFLQVFVCINKLLGTRFKPGRRFVGVTTSIPLTQGRPELPRRNQTHRRRPAPSVGSALSDPRRRRRSITYIWVPPCQVVYVTESKPCDGDRWHSCPPRGPAVGGVGTGRATPPAARSAPVPVAWMRVSAPSLQPTSHCWSLSSLRFEIAVEALEQRFSCVFIYKISRSSTTALKIRVLGKRNITRIMQISTERGLTVRLGE